MKCLFTLIFSLLCFGTIWAQTNAKIDSLEKVIATTKVDTVRGRSLCRLCQELSILGDFESARKYVDAGLKINEAQKDIKGIAYCVFIKGNTDYSQSNYFNALQCYQRSMKMYEQIADQYGISSCISNIGNVYYSQDNYPKALEYYAKSLKMREQLNDREGVASCIGNIGNIYLEKGNYPKALEYYHRALQIYEKLGNQRFVALSLDNIGGIYNYQGNLVKALACHQRSLQIFKQIGDQLGIANTMLNIGLIYDQQGKAAEAFDYHQKSLHIYEKVGNQENAALCLNNLAGFYKDQQNYPKALIYFQKSLHIREQINDSMGIGECWSNIAIILIKQHNHNLAKIYAKKGLIMAQKIQNLIHMKRSAEALYFADSALGNFQEAIRWYKLYKEYSDSLNSNAQSLEFGRLEAKFDYEKEQELQKKQAELQRLQEQERRMQMSYIFGSIIAGVLVLTGFIFYRYRSKTKLNRALQNINEELAFKNKEVLTQRDELSIRNEEITTQRDELAAQADHIAEQRDELDKAYHKIESAFRKLKELDEFKEAMSGMIVHDLKNPLSAIIGISNKDHLSHNDQVAIRQAGKQMLNLTLNILDVQKFEQAQVPLNLRDEALSQIVHDAIEQVSLLMSNKNLQLTITIQPTTGVFCDFELISRVLMNLLTNAIKYTPNNGRITIGAEELPDNQVKISVSDTGQGIPADKFGSVFDKFSQVEAKKSGGARSTGLGLTFCKLTVEAHGGQIGVESEVGAGTTFYFTLSKSLAEVKAVQPIILPMNDDAEIQLTEEDKTLLQPFLPQLQALDVYDAGDVLKVIAQIPDTPALSAWKSEMERTIFASNQERYDELIIKN